MPKWTVITAIICIAILEGIALLKGINGAALAAAIAILAGLGGWVIPTPRRKR